jgi:integrase
MASLEKRAAGYRIKFRFGGRQLSAALGTESQREAKQALSRLEENLTLVERGRLEIPQDGDIAVFLLSDGKINRKPVLEAPLTLQAYFKRYQARSTDAKERNTRYTEKIHIDHLLDLLGKSEHVRSITTEVLQRYVDQRAKEKFRGETISHKTIQKEIGTFASIWNKWGIPEGLVSGPAPTKGQVYKKDKGKGPFQTWEQIERRIARGQEDDLWDTLFLTLPEVDELLKHVKGSRFPFVYPMFVFAARTGARRSEILRSQIDDFDFATKTVRIREKKKDQSKEFTFRHVPLSPLLESVMKEWFKNHPGGSLTVCVRPDDPITPQMAAHHFVWAVEESKWKVLKGWHVFRHSFASNCAAAGVDQRVIDSWLGHQTEEMSKRYRHLFPSKEQTAMSLVFGGK